MTIRLLPPTAITEGRIEANGLDFAYLEAGSGPLALCLHGFPDTAWSWRHLLPALADAGFHAVAPFMRGYAPTAVPADGHYQIGALVDDANALHEVLGGDGDAVIIGHDWGAMATYGAAAFEPDRWRRVVTAAVPPLGAVARGHADLRPAPPLLVHVLLPEPAGRPGGGHERPRVHRPALAGLVPGPRRRRGRGPRPRRAGRPANLTAALGYYRAMFQPELQVPELQAAAGRVRPPTPQPTLYLHGRNDGCMGVDWAEGALTFLPAEGSRVEIVEDAGHFLQVEQPELVNRLIVEHVTG